MLVLVLVVVLGPLELFLLYTFGMPVSQTEYEYDQTFDADYEYGDEYEFRSAGARYYPATASIAPVLLKLIARSTTFTIASASSRIFAEVIGTITASAVKRWPLKA